MVLDDQSITGVDIRYDLPTAPTCWLMMYSILVRCVYIYQDLVSLLSSLQALKVYNICFIY